MTEAELRTRTSAIIAGALATRAEAEAEPPPFEPPQPGERVRLLAVELVTSGAVKLRLHGDEHGARQLEALGEVFDSGRFQIIELKRGGS